MYFTCGCWSQRDVYVTSKSSGRGNSLISPPIVVLSSTESVVVWALLTEPGAGGRTGGRRQVRSKLHTGPTGHIYTGYDQSWRCRVHFSSWETIGMWDKHPISYRLIQDHESRTPILYRPAPYYMMY